MIALGASAVNAASLRTVMQTWPVFNHHTDYTGTTHLQLPSSISCCPRYPFTFPHTFFH